MPPAHRQGRSATADEIRQAALEQFAQSGYEATSMREIAASVGIKAGSLYNHFASKEAILWDLTRTALSELVASRDSAIAGLSAEANLQERLAAFVGAHVAFHARHRHQALLVNSQLGSLSAPHHGKAVALRDAYESTLRSIVGDGVKAGVFSTPDLRVSTFAILQMGMAVSSWYRPDGPLSIDELCRIYVELAAKMLAPRPMAGERAR